MRFRHAFGHVAEKWRDFRLDADRLIGLAHSHLVIVARLLGHSDPLALGSRQGCDCRRDGVRTELRSLAAPEYEEMEGLTGLRGFESVVRRLDYGWPNRVSGYHGLCANAVRPLLQKTSGNGTDPAGERLVCATE